MIYQLPNENKKFVQTNRSNAVGNLWATKSMDFEFNVGVGRLGPKLVINTSNADDADLGTPVAFEFFDGRWYSICGTRVFKNATEELTSSFSEDASTNAITTYDEGSDLAVFNSRLWATASGKLMSKASSGTGAGAWTDRTGSANVSGDLEKMTYFRKFDRLYWVEANDEVASIDKSDVLALAGDYNLDLSSTSDLDGISALTSTSDRIWIGLRTADNTSTSSGGKTGSIVEWDGISAQITKEYKLIAAAVVAFCIDPENDVPYAMDTDGRVLGYTGYGFKEVGRLPLGKKKLAGATASLNEGTFIKPNGMVFTKNRTILCTINNEVEDSGATIIENLPSGVWELNLDTGSFTHKNAFTLKSRSSSTVTDFGQNRIDEVGAIALNPFANDSSNGAPTLITGARYFTDASSTAYAIFVDSPDNASSDPEGQKASYFVTTWMESPVESATEQWQKAFAFHRQFLGADDRIVLKYRKTEPAAPLEISITWVNTTSFTTSTDVSALIGYEVEGIQGTGAGGSAHITNVTGSGTYTVTLDTAVTGVTTGTAKVRLQNWTKLGEITGQTEEMAELPINIVAPRIQMKVCLFMTGEGEFHRLAVPTATHQPTS